MTFIIRGSGRPILFIHGWRLSAEVEARDIEPVFESLDGWKRIYPDLPGMGTSGPDEAITDMNGYLHALEQLVHELIPKTRGFAVGGTSAGAALALAIAHKFGERIQGVMLRVPMLDDGRRPHFATDTERDAELNLPPEGVRLPEEFLDQWSDKLDQIWRLARKISDDQIRSAPSRYRLRYDVSDKLTSPSLIIAGRQDARVGYHDAQSVLDTLPRGTLAILDLAGHHLPIGDVQLFNELVRDWLRRMDRMWVTDGTSSPFADAESRRPTRFKSGLIRLGLWKTGHDWLTKRLIRLGLWPSRSSVHLDEWFVLTLDRKEEDLRLLYQKTYDTVSTFLDWRHKSMMMGFAVLAAVVALDEWLYRYQHTHWVLGVPLFVAAIFCTMVRRFDARNQQILNDAYQAGTRLEEALGAASGAMLGRIPASRRSWTYHETIKVFFGWAAVVCVASGLAFVGWSIAAH